MLHQVKRIFMNEFLYLKRHAFFGCKENFESKYKCKFFFSLFSAFALFHLFTKLEKKSMFFFSILF